MLKNKHSYGEDSDRAMRTWTELSRAYRSISRKETAYIESCGLTLHSFAVLEALYHLGALSAGELTRLVLSTPGNMTVVLKNLRVKGLISLSRDEKDGRKSVFAVTDAGIGIINRMFPKHAENMAGYFACLSGDEQKTLSALLRKLEKANRRQS